MITQVILLVLIWIIVLGWRVLKVSIFLAVLWGAISTFTGTEIAILGDAVAWVKAADPKFFGSALIFWVAENWLPMAVSILLINAAADRRTLGELSRTGGYTRIFMATVFDYLQIETETPSLKRFRDRAWDEPVFSTIGQILKEGINELLMTRILGFADADFFDERFSARAVRVGDDARLADDIKVAVSDATKTVYDESTTRPQKTERQK